MLAVAIGGNVIVIWIVTGEEFMIFLLCLPRSWNVFYVENEIKVLKLKHGTTVTLAAIPGISSITSYTNSIHQIRAAV